MLEFYKVAKVSPQVLARHSKHLVEVDFVSRENSEQILDGEFLCDGGRLHTRLAVL